MFAVLRRKHQCLILVDQHCVFLWYKSENDFGRWTALAARGDGMHSARIEVLSKFAETCYQVTHRHGEAAITLSRNGLPKYPLGGNAGARANPSGLTSIQIRLKTNVPGQFA